MFANSYEILRIIDHDVQVCADVLKAYADKAMSKTPLYFLACKIAGDAQVSPAEVEVARGYRDVPGSEQSQPVELFAELLSAYHPGA